METRSGTEIPVVSVLDWNAPYSHVLICEHASNHFPEKFGQLGISDKVAKSHIAWDPGAYEVSKRMSAIMKAPLVKAEVSRLIYDCNRPPKATGATPAKSEIFEIPGNRDLGEIEREERYREVYLPFSKCIEETIAQAFELQSIVTIHSFTPVYEGQKRDVEIGILHDTDTRLADAMLQLAHLHSGLIVRPNEPYGPLDGVTHTLRKHGIANGVANVMIEIRNDLIETDGQCDDMAEMICGWFQEALSRVENGPGQMGQAV
ncbi:MAG: N-formylglutamate amidohydrolase [Pseudomonadota bacterium]